MENISVESIEDDGGGGDDVLNVNSFSVCWQCIFLTELLFLHFSFR